MNTTKTPVLFFEVKSKEKVNEKRILEISKELPKVIALTYSIQFQEIANQIKKILESQGHRVNYLTQVLGCSNPKFPEDTEGILMVSGGKFHAIGVAYETKLPLWILDKDNLHKINKEDLSIIEKKEKATNMRYLNAEKVGIIISTKPGQLRLQRSLKLKEKIKDKKTYLFLSNNVDINEFDNFDDIDCWVNTACPRMDMNDTNNDIINLAKVEELAK